MKIIKGGSSKSSVCTDEELKAVNAFAKAELSADDVYIFSVLLCDNEVDRDYERFSEATLRATEQPTLVSRFMPPSISAISSEFASVRSI